MLCRFQAVSDSWTPLFRYICNHTLDAELPPLPSLEGFSLAVSRTDFYGNTVILRSEWQDLRSADPVHSIQACYKFRARSSMKIAFALPAQNVCTRIRCRKG